MRFNISSRMSAPAIMNNRKSIPMNQQNYVRLLFAILIMVTLTSCDPKAIYREDNCNDQQWVYISIESFMRKDSTDYFYYGQVSKKLIDRLNKGNSSGYFVLKNIRYFNDSDKLQLYADSSWMGTKVFRVKDIVKMNLLTRDPVLAYKKDELEDNARHFLEKMKPVEKKDDEGVQN